MSSIADTLKLYAVPDDRCRLSILLGSLDTEDSEGITNAMRKGVSPNSIAKAIRSGGHKISHSTIAEHKAKQCRCQGEFQWV